MQHMSWVEGTTLKANLHVDPSSSIAVGSLVPLCWVCVEILRLFQLSLKRPESSTSVAEDLDG